MNGREECFRGILVDSLETSVGYLGFSHNIYSWNGLRVMREFEHPKESRIKSFITRKRLY